jgi:aryl-alcohol dehydrogenase-like predicted oxidoreductase
MTTIAGIDVTGLCLGGNIFGWTAEKEESFAVLDAFVEAGGTMIDTADSYLWRKPGNSGGESETIIGEWLADRGLRDRVVIATKVGSWPAHPGLSAANIGTAVEGSLRRLRTDRIDLYYAHKDDPDTAQEETLDAFDGLVRAGKVREIGASNFTPERLRSALEISERDGLTVYTAIQPHYNLMERDAFEAGLEPLVTARDLACFPYYGLAKGFLTGKYRGSAVESVRAAGAQEYLDDPRGPGVLAVLDEIAAGHGAPVAAVALAWLAARSGVTAPIASARTVAQLKELMAMRTLTLTADELRLLAHVSA